KSLGRIVVDSLPELQRVAQLAETLEMTANVMLRLTPGVNASTHQHIATAHEDQKFGLTMTPAPGAETSAAYQAVTFAAGCPHINLWAYILTSEVRSLNRQGLLPQQPECWNSLRSWPPNRLL